MKNKMLVVISVVALTLTLVIPASAGSNKTLPTLSIDNNTQLIERV